MGEAQINESLDDDLLLDYTKFKDLCRDWTSSLNFRSACRMDNGQGPFNKSYQALQRECFARLPQSIQYLTPAAAAKLRSNLYQWMSLNVDNLPAGMFIREREDKTYVLDYDPGFHRHYNIFTPTDNLRYVEETQPYFKQSSLTKDFHKTVAKLFTVNIDKKITEHLPLLKRDNYIKTYFVNFYVRHGQEKLEQFINLFQVDNLNLNPSIKHCLNRILNDYVFSYRQIEFMGEGDWFLNCIKRIKSEEDEDKLLCFTSLITASKATRHDLEHTLNVFDVFWETEKQKYSPKDLKNIRFGGQEDDYHETSEYLQEKTFNHIPPSVAMERVLTLLHNASHVSEQIKYLSDLPLGTFQAPHASKEGFRVLHKDMRLTWEPNGYPIYEMDALPSNLSYFKNNFILIKDKLFYITQEAKTQSVEISTSTRIKWRFSGEATEPSYLTYFKALKKKKFLILAEENLEDVTSFKPPFPPIPESSNLYTLELSTLKHMALNEDVIHYPTFHAYIHRYLGKHQDGMSYANFREETKDFSFNAKNKVLIFTLLMLVTSLYYEKEIGIKTLLLKLKQLSEDKLKKFSEALFTLHCEGIIFNNREGLQIINAYLEDEETLILEELAEKKRNQIDIDAIIKNAKTLNPLLNRRIRDLPIPSVKLPLNLNILKLFDMEMQKKVLSIYESNLELDLEKCFETFNTLRSHGFPDHYFPALMRLNKLNISTLLQRFQDDPDDPILSYILSNNFHGDSTDVETILELTKKREHNHKITAFLQQTNLLKDINSADVLEILAKSYHTLPPSKSLTHEKWQALIQHIEKPQTKRFYINSINRQVQTVKVY